MQFDEQMTFITSGFVQISTAAQFSKEHVVLPPITIDRNGFVMAYVSNESNQLNYVHFDDFTVTHSKTPVIYASSFEPFGLEFATFNRSYSEKTRYKFQAQELDETTRWYAFKYRNHDPVLGRFFNVDPLAEMYLYNSTYAFSENNITNNRELEGLEKGPRAATSQSLRNNGSTFTQNYNAVMRRANRESMQGNRLGQAFRAADYRVQSTYKYSTSRGNKSSLNTVNGYERGFDDNEHSMGTRAGNGAKVLNQIYTEAKQIVDAAGTISVTESFLDNGAGGSSTGSDIVVGSLEQTAQLAGLQQAYETGVNNLALEIGGVSQEEFGKLELGQQAGLLMQARVEAGPSPMDLVNQQVQQSEKVDEKTLNGNQAYIRAN